MRRLVPLLFLFVSAACSSLAYDLGDVPFAVSAKPAPKDDPGEPFAITAKSVLWVHGLCGRIQPDVGALLAEQCRGCREVDDFRVSVGASFHDWLLTHLTLGLVRLKTVTVTGRRHAGGNG